MENKISYLRGYLKGFELINSFVNDGKTYLAEILPKENNIQDTLSRYYNTKNWTFHAVNTESSQWESILRLELEPYFSQIISDVYCTFNRKDLMSYDLYFHSNVEEKVKRVKAYYQNNIEMILSEFIFLVKSIVKDSGFTKVEVECNTEEYEDFYECYANDYIFDLGNYYLYLHFGGSD